MTALVNLIASLMFAAFIALKITGVAAAWSWWWVLFPTVPVIAAAIGHA